MRADNNQYDWKFCFSDGKNGHSLWFDRISERYSIKDQSGRRPHLTDDGVCWFGCGVATVSTSPYSKDGLETKFSVNLLDNEISKVFCQFEFGVRVAREIKIEIVFDDKLKNLVKLVSSLDSEQIKELIK